MGARRLDGAEIARQIKEELRARLAELAATGVRPGLGVLLVGDDPASAVYVRSKTRACEELGMLSETRRLPATATTDEVAAAVVRVQPAARHPRHPRAASAAAAGGRDARARPRGPAKDVDGFHPENVGRLVQKRPRFVPCTPAGIMELLARHGIEVAGRRAVVLGRSDIVGKPMALLLMHADATVTVCHSRTRDLAAVCREADILVAAIGRAGFVRAEHVKPGAVVIDVGMNRVEDPRQARDLLVPERLAEIREEGPRARGRRARPLGARGGVGAHARAGGRRPADDRPAAEEHGPGGGRGRARLRGSPCCGSASPVASRAASPTSCGGSPATASTPSTSTASRGT